MRLVRAGCAAGLLLCPVLAGGGSTAAARTLQRTDAAGPAVLAFRMATPGIGWAVTATRLFRTNDGGRSWTDKTPHGLGKTFASPTPAGGPPTSLAVDDVNSAWIAAPSPGTVRIFSTADGGLHWRMASVIPTLTAGVPRTDVPTVLGLDFPDRRDGWLLTSAGGIAAGSEDVELYRTADAGRTWRLAAAATQQHPSPGGLPAGGVKTGLAFFDARRGVLTGYRGSQPGIWLYTTDDGGRSWRAGTLPTPARYAKAPSFPMTFAPFRVARTLVLPASWPSQRTAIFYTSPDGGLHWHASSPVATGPGSLRAWSWSDLTHGFAITNASLCTTSSGGRTWHCRQTPRALADPRELQFLTPHRGWALDGSHLLRTTNGGATWVIALR